MKKLIAILLSILLIISIFIVSVNAVTYKFDTVDAYANLNFFVDDSKCQNCVFKNLTLKIKWRGLLETEENIKNIATTNISCADVENKITEKSNYSDYLFNGETTFSLKNENGADLSDKIPFLTMKINRNAMEGYIDYYVEGEFVSADGVDYSKKDIIKTDVTLDKTDKIGEPFFFHLNVNNIGETEGPAEQQYTVLVRETQETESTPATTTPTETVQPTTSATENPEPTEPAPTVSKPKQANPIKVTAKTKTIKAKKLKRSKVTVNALTVKKAKGEVKYKKLSGSKKLTVNKKGKITIKKRTKKGTYKIKIKITAKGTKKYKSKTVTKKVTIKIK